MTKIFFSGNIKWSSKNLWKRISADVKANIKQQEIKDLVVVSYKFLLEVPSKLEIQCKEGVHF